MEYFIFGFLLATIGVNLIDGISTLIVCVVELAKAKISIKIAEYNSKITELSINKEDNKNSIGFKTE